MGREGGEAEADFFLGLPGWSLVLFNDYIVVYLLLCAQLVSALAGIPFDAGNIFHGGHFVHAYMCP